MRRVILRRGVALAIALLSWGCDPSPQEAPDSSTPAAADSLGSRTTATSDSVSAAGEAALALDGEGLRLFLLPSGSSRLLAFGTTDEAALGTISTVLDAAPVEEAFSEDCQARLARWENGLTTWFADDHFVGWSTGALGEGLTTPTGVGVGSTRAQVESSYQLQVFQSTLGTEFTAGGMAGLFESAEPNARVLVLWAGQTCIAR